MKVVFGSNMVGAAFAVAVSHSGDYPNIREIRLIKHILFYFIVVTVPSIVVIKMVVVQFLVLAKTSCGRGQNCPCA